MYEISFVARDKIIVKKDINRIWKSLSPVSSAILTKINNNYFLRHNHPICNKVTYLGCYEGLLKYHNSKICIDIHAYYFNGTNLRINRNIKRIRWQVQNGLIVPTELYIPNILFNGRGLWVVNHSSPMSKYTDKSNNYSYVHSRDFGVKSIGNDGVVDDQ